MSKRDTIYNQFSENGYPEELDEKKEFAAQLFGARIVGALDSTLDDKIAILNGTGDEKYSEIMNCFSTMTEDQKKAVELLLKDSCSSFLYWMLVKMRNFPDALELNIFELDEATDTLKKICDVGENVELHHRYFDWIEEFSDHIEEP